MDFVFTSDLDWASEYCIEDLLGVANRFSLKPTLFVTHRSDAVRAALRSGRVTPAIHPNFRPGSDHGDDVPSVMNSILQIVPNALYFRSHHFFDSPEIAAILPKHGLKVDSNVCRHLASGLSATILENGLLRLPVFFEDDVHWVEGREWNFAKYADIFFGPGLKVMNFHPFFVALNVPDADFYRRHKHFIRTLTAEQAARLRYRGPGPRTFLLEAVQAIYARKHQFISLGELAAQFSAVPAPTSAEPRG